MTSKIIRFRRSSSSSSSRSLLSLSHANRASDNAASSNNNNNEDDLSTATIVEKALSNLAIHHEGDDMGVPSPRQEDDYARFDNPAQDGYDFIQEQDDRNELNDAEDEDYDDDDLPQFCLVPPLGSTTTTAFGGSRHSPMSVHDMPVQQQEHTSRPVGPPLMPDLDHPTASAPLTLPLRRRTTYNEDDDETNTRRSRLIRRCFAWSEDSSEDLGLPSKRQRRTSSSWSEQQDDDEEEKLGNSWIYWEERVVHP